MAFLHMTLCLALLASTSGKRCPPAGAVAGAWSLDRNGFHFCGGSLINQNWMVTAAHSGTHFAILGEYDRSSRAEPIQVKSIAKAITHPYWNASTMNNITLLKLAFPAQLGARVSPVCLATASESLASNPTCITTSCGQTTSGGAVWLQQVALPLVIVSHSMICVGGAGASSCQGDSGSPLMYLKGGHCNVRTPAMYGRVSAFRTWIDSILASN
uniref:Peptidase S1 domain-containing protein n=1 Tax=Gopherus agassizii TaxID=38772 RepID=A0A452ISD3_9SAUR